MGKKGKQQDRVSNKEFINYYCTHKELTTIFNELRLMKYEQRKGRH